MADAVLDSTDPQAVQGDGSNDSIVAAELTSAENGTVDVAEEAVSEPPKKRGRPASGTAPRRTPKRKSKEEKPPTQPTRRSTRRSVSSRSSEATTPTEKLEEPIEAVVKAAEAEKSDVDGKTTDGAPIETEDKNDNKEISADSSANEKSNESDATQQVEAEA